MDHYKAVICAFVPFPPGDQAIQIFSIFIAIIFLNLVKKSHLTKTNKKETIFVHLVPTWEEGN